MLILRVGEQYPLQLKASEGAAINLLNQHDNTLQVVLPNIRKSELNVLKNGKITAGLIVEQPLILFVFRFGDITFECPFDSRIIKKPDLTLHNIDNQEQRLTVTMHVVDSETNILHLMKHFTLSPWLTRLFLSSVQDQLTHLESIDYAYMKYMKLPVEQLALYAKMTPCGINE